MAKTLYTIGYESASLGAVIQTLQGAGVSQVVDVRAVAASRRAGFSKTILRNSLEAEGIAYEHLRPLGTPKDGRDAARKGRIGEMERIYSKHLETPEAQDALAKAQVITMEQKSALLCYEACATGCHRNMLSDLIQQATGCHIQHLNVPLPTQ